ncbi:glycoside hydrolase family 16 protein [Telluribacter sp.]|jgi:beta-glucanase (GH16 family)|uniref:glycoside hydrolase family 16 protein n=1 Tax=Telluribacter sp. TaxID=1978767 RepID=UPI002E0ED53E|nr:glycoside hydrolase family 16 protein [Telluribacter sp.]
MKQVVVSSAFFILSVSLAFRCKESGPVPPPAGTISTQKEYTFSTSPVWADEFDYTGKPNPEKWSYNLGGHGWGNNELQNYTDKSENARVENGMLTIQVRKEPSGNRQYSSARLVTKDKGDFIYGKFEVRAKLPSGRGTWPAIWTLASQSNYGDKFWPDNGEIDIMEHVGFDQNRVHGNIHTKAFNHAIKTNKGNNVIVEGASTGFHVYSCEWTPERVTVLVDGKDYFTFKKEPSYGWQEWPFDWPFHLILNIAVGGNWGGQKGVDDSVFPQKMEVDYVRVYELIEKK